MRLKPLLNQEIDKEALYLYISWADPISSEVDQKQFHVEVEWTIKLNMKLHDFTFIANVELVNDQ